MSGRTVLHLSPQDRARIAAASALVDKIVASGEAAYGINTGFGLLAQTRIPREQLELLQRNLLLSHAAGVGDLLPDAVVRLMIAFKIKHWPAAIPASAGARDALQRAARARGDPMIPAQGSVGASGDLAPLAHLSAALLGKGHIRVKGARVPAATACAARACNPSSSRQRRPGADQRHAGLDRPRLGGPIRRRAAVRRRGRRRGHVGRCPQGQRCAFRYAHSRGARSARPDRRGRANIGNCSRAAPSAPRTSTARAYRIPTRSAASRR